MPFSKQNGVALFSFFNLFAVGISHPMAVETPARITPRIGFWDSRNLAQQSDFPARLASNQFDFHSAQPGYEGFFYHQTPESQIHHSPRQQSAGWANFDHPSSAGGSTPSTYEITSESPINDGPLFIGAASASPQNMELVETERRRRSWKDLFRSPMTNVRSTKKDKARSMIERFERNREVYLSELLLEIEEVERLKFRDPESIQTSIKWTYYFPKTGFKITKNVKSAGIRTSMLWVPAFKRDFKKKDRVVGKLFDEAKMYESLGRHDEVIKNVAEASKISRIAHENLIGLVRAGYNYFPTFGSSESTFKSTPNVLINRLKSKFLN